MKSILLRVAVSNGNSKSWKYYLLRLVKLKIRHLKFQIFFSFVHLLLSICCITTRKALHRYLYRDFSCPRKMLYKVINKKELQNRCFGTAFTWASFPPNRWWSKEILLWDHIKLNAVSTNFSYSKNISDKLSPHQWKATKLDSSVIFISFQWLSFCLPHSLTKVSLWFLKIWGDFHGPCCLVGGN